MIDGRTANDVKHHFYISNNKSQSAEATGPKGGGCHRTENKTIQHYKKNHILKASLQTTCCNSYVAERSLEQIPIAYIINKVKQLATL